MIVAKRLVARGRVQGVWYRASAKEEADRFGVKGWVRNLRDGSVEVHAEGEGDAVARLIEWMRQGPSLARVTAVDEQDAPLGNFSSFSLR
jgi:acylphosphatase